VRRLIPLSFLVLLLLTACTATSPVQRPQGNSSITGSQLFHPSGPGDWYPFQLTASRAGDLLGVAFRGTVITGPVHVRVMDSAGHVLWQETAAKGTFNINHTLSVPTPGVYRAGIAWDGPVKVNYSLFYAPRQIPALAVSPVALIGGLGMLLVALGFVAYAASRHLGWRFLGLGALVWIITVALKFAWAIPINPAIYAAMQGLPPPLLSTLFNLYVGALTGIFEVGLTWLLLRYTRLGRVTWSRALAFGIGFGVVEALLLGLGNLSVVISILILPDAFAPELIEQVAAGNDPLRSLAPVWERFFFMWVHITANVALFYAVARRRSGWFWLAFLYKTLIDALASWGGVWATSSLAGLWTIEGISALWGAAGWLLVWHMARDYPGCRPEGLRAATISGPATAAS
jgi:uncharacterized membrane protein YhfC